MLQQHSRHWPTLHAAPADPATQDNPVIMEVNSSPGLEGIEKASGKDIASRIIAFIEENAIAGKTKTKGEG